MATGPGYNDAEGIYQYGEDDNETLFSDLLNRGQESVSQQFAVDRTRLDDLERIQSGTVARINDQVAINSPRTTLKRVGRRVVLHITASRPAGFVHAAAFATASMAPPTALGTVPGFAINEGTGHLHAIAITTAGSVLFYNPPAASPAPPAPTAISGTIIWDIP